MSVVIENISKKFGKRSILEIESLLLKKGEITGVLGPDGAGKTTILKMLAGFLHCEKSSIKIKQDLSFNSKSDQKRIGYLAQDNPLYDDMNVIDFLTFIAKIYHVPQSNIVSRVSEVISLFELQGERHKYIRELSKGFRQRIGIAQAIIHDPDIVVLDEPTKGLDPNQTAAIYKILKTICSDKIILTSSRLTSDNGSIYDRILFLNEGRIVASGTASELKQLSGNKLYFRILIKGGKSQQIFKALSEMPEIQQINPTHNQSFELQCGADCEIESSIFKVCRQHNWYIAELTPIQAGLEDVFYQIIQNNMICVQ